jgi:hypothetical protein
MLIVQNIVLCFPYFWLQSCNCAGLMDFSCTSILYNLLWVVVHNMWERKSCIIGERCSTVVHYTSENVCVKLHILFAYSFCSNHIPFSWISIIVLQMSDDNPYVIPEMDPTMRNQIQQCNWQVVNVTTPANYFHVLRRQVKSWYFPPSWRSQPS